MPSLHEMTTKTVSKYILGSLHHVDFKVTTIVFLIHVKRHDNLTTWVNVFSIVTKSGHKECIGLVVVLEVDGVYFSESAIRNNHILKVLDLIIIIYNIFIKISQES